MSKSRANIAISSRERFVKGAYASMDQAIAGRLNRLRDEEGLHPACSPGCCHCCRYHIVTNMAEAHTLAQYIKREWEAGQINDLKIRTRQWHAWDNSQPGRIVSTGIDWEIDLSRYEACCPLLVEGACGVYPVRPAVCRTHFVSTPPLTCQSASHPGSSAVSPVTLASIVEAADPYCLAIKEHIEGAGWDYQRTLMLLPHWLGVAMGWDFGISL